MIDHDVQRRYYSWPADWAIARHLHREHGWEIQRIAKEIGRPERDIAHMVEDQNERTEDA